MKQHSNGRFTEAIFSCKCSECRISEVHRSDYKRPGTALTGYQRDTSGYELIQAENAKLKAVCEELQAHNDTLKQDLQDLKAMHNNYMLQMQSLINQRAIEAPGAKKPWWKVW